MDLTTETVMRHHLRLSALFTTAVLIGCSERPTEPGSSKGPAEPPAFAILDGAHGGNQQFYFLPPLVPAPAYSGTFDASQSPVVTICELAGGTCGTTVASFSGSAVKLDLDAQAYVAIWKTKGAGLDPAKTYRIQVLVGAQVLGYADVVVLSNGSQIKTVDKDQFVSVINGGVLKIRFRIESGAPPPPPPPGGWQNGDLVTYNQDNWGTPNTAAALLLGNYFDFIYPGGVQIGLSGNGFSAVFTSADAVLAYLPATGASGVFDNDLYDPVATSAGIFAGYALAVQLDVDFGDAHHLDGAATLLFGDLRVCGLTATPGLNGSTVRQVLGVLNQALGGGTTPYSVDTVAQLAYDLSQSFESGAPSAFAQAHLVNGTCPGGWVDGNMTTHSQDQWGDGATTAGTLLNDYFATVYFSTGGLLVGLVPTFNMTFDSPQAIFDYQPATGTAAPLNANLSNPTSTASGSFGGEVVGLKLNVDFSDNNLLPSSANLHFGDLLICGVNSAIDGGNVRTFLGYANSALGGGSAPLTITELNSIAIQLNASFGEGAVSVFAEQHLFAGSCPGGWEDGQVITHTQLDWGDPVSSAGILLADRYDFVYFETGGVLEVGLLGAAGFSMAFTSATAILAYQPAIGNVGALDADLVDPTTSASGAFGGEVVALKLNIDFAAAGHTVGSSGLQFGALTLCGFPSNPALNGISVNDFLTMLNAALGGGSAPYTISVLHLIAEEVNAAFSNGTPSSFAQAHFVNGACP